MSFLSEDIYHAASSTQIHADIDVNVAIKQPQKYKKEIYKDLETLSNNLPQQGRINCVKIETLYHEWSLCGYSLTSP